jgi:hypothetical protein
VEVKTGSKNGSKRAKLVEVKTGSKNGIIPARSA